MPVYRVTYAHDNSEKHGYAMQEVEVDHDVTTVDDLFEIARVIGNNHGYTSVGIIKTELKVHDEEDTLTEDSE